MRQLTKDLRRHQAALLSATGKERTRYLERIRNLKQKIAALKLVSRLKPPRKGQ